MTEQAGPGSIDHAFTGERRGGAGDPTYAGALSFMRRRYGKDVAGCDLVIWGVPFDLAVTNRPGARFGPRAIREQTSLVACYPWGIYPWDFNPFERCNVIDYSDIAFTTAYPERMVTAVEHHVGSILAAGASVLSLGGDHMVAYPLVKAYAQHHGPLSLVHFDAHSDTWGMGEDLNHGTWAYLATRHGHIDPSRSIQLGMRSPNPETLGFEIVEADPLLTMSPAEAVERMLHLRPAVAEEERGHRRVRHRGQPGQRRCGPEPQRGDRTASSMRLNHYTVGDPVPEDEIGRASCRERV